MSKVITVTEHRVFTHTVIVPDNIEIPNITSMHDLNDFIDTDSIEVHWDYDGETIGDIEI
jgi:hypothetical protein